MALPEGVALALAWIGGPRFARRVCARSREIDEQEKKKRDEQKRRGSDGE